MNENPEATEETEAVNMTTTEKIAGVALICSAVVFAVSVIKARRNRKMDQELWEEAVHADDK